MTLIAPDNWEPQGVDELENRAWVALRETERSVCVTAGAGAGKTEFLAQKAAYLLQTGLCPTPKRILAISFKRDAAATLSERVARRCSPDQARRFISVTFDAFSKGLVDQFRLAIPEPYRPPVNYHISLPTKDILNDFLIRHNLQHITYQQFEKAISKRRLLDDEQGINKKTDDILNSYWNDQYTNSIDPQLSFPMINRLAEYLLRSNHRIRRGVRMTYPVVFLDEFQDTQTSQFEILKVGFDGSGTVFTAVGDEKQSIMGWAGAMPDPFNTFIVHYDALTVSLLLNWRSHADLVAVQHVIAANIDPNVEPVVARGICTVAGSVSAIWNFPDEETEVETLAAWIAAEIEHGIPAHEIAILVRSLANKAENEIAPALAQRGLVLRNLARNVGSISIEDLLSEDLTDILMPFLRLATSRRHPEAWSQALKTISRLDATKSDNDDQLQALNRRVERIIKFTRAFLKSNSVEQTTAKELLSILVDLIGEDSIRRSTPNYQRDADYARVRKGFEILLAESLDGAKEWSEALDRFEGRDQVPLLTVHKSKGMEFHTMIFFGLDSKTWWSLKPNSTEEKNSFFVAFTRAMQRAFFTSCEHRGDRIVWLEELLGDAVPRVEGASILSESH